MKLPKKIISCGVAASLIISVFAAKGIPESKSGDTRFTLPDTTMLESETNRHTMYASSAKTAEKIGTEGYELKLRNNRLQIWFREKTHAIRVEDLKNGHIWGTLESDKPEGMNAKWSAMGNSVCTIDYFNEALSESRISISDRSAETEYSWNNDSVNCKVWFPNIEIGFSFTLTLLEDGFKIELDKGSLTETGDCKIKSLYFLPFLGSVRENATDGYLLIPDGPGALIRFGNKGDYVSGYDDKVYGLDMGIDTLSKASDLEASRTNDYLIDSEQITMPIFGIAYLSPKNSFLGIIEDGFNSANIIASPAGFTTDYFWTTARFDFRQLYAESTGTAGKGIFTTEEKPKKITPAVRYVLFAGDNADYSGMATAYRGILKENGELNTERKDSDIPLRLDVVGSEIKKNLFFKSTEVFTTAKQAEGFLTRLENSGIKNITLAFEGWQRGGINGSKYGALTFNKNVGSRKDFQALNELLKQKGGRFYLQINPITANKDQINENEMGTVTASNSVAKFVRQNDNIMYNESFLVKPSKAVKTVEKYRKNYSDFSLSIEQLGSRLYSDFTRSSVMTRDESAKGFSGQIKDMEQSVALSRVNSYLWKYTDEYFDIPTSCSQYLFETDTVPFLQIVLKGSMDYYAPYANQGFYTTESILKMAEYGCYPSFMVTASDNHSLTDTPLEDYFSLNFENWYPQIEKIYNRLNEVLSMAEGQYIVEHKAIGVGVYRVTYSGGTVIYVNYGSQPFTDGKVTVEGQSFCAGGKQQ